MMMKSIKRALRCTALAGAIGLLAGPASAFYLYPNDATIFEDNDIERLINAAGSPDNTLLEEGDRLRGVLTIDALSSGSGTGTTQGLMGGSSANLGDPEITAIFDLEVKSATQNLNGTWNFVFGPTATFEATYGLGAVVAFYYEAAGDLVLITDGSSCDKVANGNTCEADATNGTHLWTFGFGDDLDAQWDAIEVASNDVSVIAALSATTQAGDYNFALQLLNNYTGYNIVPHAIDGCGALLTCAGDGFIELTGSGTVNGGLNLQSGWDARSDFQFKVVTAEVPEPSSLALVGLALAAAGGLARRRKA